MAENATKICPMSENTAAPSALDEATSSGTDQKTNPAMGTSGNDAQPQEPQEQHLKGWKLASVMLAVTLVAILVFLDISIVTTAVPEITTAFNSLKDVGWYGAAYQLSASALQPLTGKLYSRFHSKWIFLTFVGIFEGGSLICALANSSTMLIVGRAVAGLGSSGLMNGGLTIIAESAPISRRPMLVGIVMGFGQIGLAAGPLIGGSFTEFVSWRWCFYINLPIGAVTAALLVFTHIPDNKSIGRTESIARIVLTKLDLPGFALFAPAAIMLLLALEYGSHEFGWDSSQTIGLFVGAGVTAIIFFFWESRVGDEAMIPLSMFKRRIVAASLVLSVAIMCNAVIAGFYLPIYFQSIRDYGPFKSGVNLLPTILSQLVFAAGGGFLIGKLGYYLPWAVGGTILVTIGSGLLSTIAPHTEAGKLIGYQIILGSGRGAALQVPILAAQATLPMSQVSVAMALIVFTQQFSGAVFLTIADTIFSHGLRDGLAAHAPELDAGSVIAAGGTGFRQIVPSSSLQGVLEAFSDGVAGVFYLLTGLGVLGFIFSWAVGWVDIREKKDVSKEKGQA